MVVVAERSLKKVTTDGSICLSTLRFISCVNGERMYMAEIFRFVSKLSTTVDRLYSDKMTLAGHLANHRIDPVQEECCRAKFKQGVDFFLVLLSPY